MNRLVVKSFVVLLFVSVFGLSGCSLIKVSQPANSAATVNSDEDDVKANDSVKPWERGYLAKPEMAWQPDSLQSDFLNHAYTSKEAASGGDKTAGGGCGCN